MPIAKVHVHVCPVNIIRFMYNYSVIESLNIFLFFSEVQKKSLLRFHSFGVAYLDLSTLLDGLKVNELTLPIVSNQMKGSGMKIKLIIHVQ